MQNSKKGESKKHHTASFFVFISFYLDPSIRVFWHPSFSLTHKRTLFLSQTHEGRTQKWKANQSQFRPLKKLKEEDNKKCRLQHARGTPHTNPTTNGRTIPLFSPPPMRATGILKMCGGIKIKETPYTACRLVILCTYGHIHTDQKLQLKHSLTIVPPPYFYLISATPT